MALILKDNQHVAIVLEADDVRGNAVPFVFPTPPVWTSSDESILTVSVNEDGSNADVRTTGKLGNAQINVQGTADGDVITGLLDIVVATSKPITFKLIPSEPSDI